jgi:hypothetical protein
MHFSSRLPAILLPVPLMAAFLMSTIDVRAAGKAYSDVEFSRPGGYSLKLDAHVPEGDGPFPAIVIVHGGALGHRGSTAQRRAAVRASFRCRLRMVLNQLPAGEYSRSKI